MKKIDYKISKLLVLQKTISKFALLTVGIVSVYLNASGCSGHAALKKELEQTNKVVDNTNKVINNTKFHQQNINNLPTNSIETPSVTSGNNAETGLTNSLGGKSITSEDNQKITRKRTNSLSLAVKKTISQADDALETSQADNDEEQFRIHTSAASVVVLPEAGEVEIGLHMNDIRKDTFCSSGPGGQSVNTTYSAVRLTHIPTNIVVSCQDGKSQIKNFEKALKVLRSRLYDIELKKHQEAIGAERKSMIKSGNRSDKIRTYNYPQARVTDHRINYTEHNLESVLNGDLETLIEALRIADNAEKLQAGTSTSSL